MARTKKMLQPQFDGKLVIASHNQGKLREFQQILKEFPVEVMLVDNLPEVDEIGNTYAQNALLKARSAAEFTGQWAIGDDSGLEVDALNGEPGLYSARWAGKHTRSKERNDLLRERMAGVPENERTARFQAAVAIVTPTGRGWMGYGTVEGLIAAEDIGADGFGYDPIFIVSAYGKTMAQLGPEIKNKISHRALATQHVMTEMWHSIHSVSKKGEKS